jgi:hypothetical protein
MRIRLRTLFLTFIPVLVVVAASCSGGSPTDPSPDSGAKVNGQFVTSGQGGTRAMQSVGATSSAQGLTVSVAGTGISAPVSGNAFSLSGVPAGPLSLRFTGNGMDSELGLAPVDGTENIDLTVSLTGSTVALESERRSFGKEMQLEGLVESLPPTTAAGAFTVAGQLVTTTPETRFFFHGDTAEFADLALGFRVHVKGQAVTGSLAAVTVMIQSTNTKVDDEEADEEDSEQDESASIEGVLTSLGGTGTTLALVVGGTTVHTDASTRVRRRGDTQDLDVLEIGMRLHVVGTRQADSSILARMIQIKGDAAGSLFEVEGAMGGVKGTCPSLTFSINGFAIATDGATVFTPACSSAAYKSGTKATVEGIVQSNGSIKAMSVTK